MKEEDGQVEKFLLFILISEAQTSFLRHVYARLCNFHTAFLLRKGPTFGQRRQKSIFPAGSPIHKEFFPLFLFTIASHNHIAKK
jgi:hypothetical protein